MENALSKLFADSYEPLVYHYCSLPSFEAIIENRCFWAADLRSMNDPREVKGSIPTVQAFLEGMAFSDGSLSAQLLEEVRKKFEAFNGFARFFCASFTSADDDLYSWLNYGSRGAGFALGVRREAYSDFYWHDVTYSDDVFRRKLTTLWDKGNSSVAGGTPIDEASTTLAVALQRAAVSNKHTSWASERESRMIFPVLINPEDSDLKFDLDIIGDDILREKKVHFRSNAFGLRPYVEVNLILPNEGQAKNALSEVVLGPNNSSEIEVVQAFLSANGFKGVRVQQSRCEFR